MVFEKQLDIFWCIIHPIHFMIHATTYIPSTILTLIRRGEYAPFFSISLFKDAWFANFWGSAGPQMREHVTPRAGPLIEKARGVVLDIGPGSGEWLEFFDKSKVTKIYGVEPNRDHHPALKKRIEEAELEGIYEIVPVGVEDLGEKWIGKGEVDAIVTIQCLCSVPQPKRMIGELYSYLKKGGIWVVYEHVVAFKHQGKLIKGYQAAMDIFWPHFLGGCSLTRDTERWLKEVGTWTKIDLHQPEDEPSYHVLPHTMGVLTK